MKSTLGEMFIPTPSFRLADAAMAVWIFLQRVAARLVIILMTGLHWVTPTHIVLGSVEISIWCLTAPYRGRFLALRTTYTAGERTAAPFHLRVNESCNSLAVATSRKAKHAKQERAEKLLRKMTKTGINGSLIERQRATAVRH